MDTFIVIEFFDTTIDYPKDMPVPNKDDFIRIGPNSGFVTQISYTIENSFREIRLIVK